MGSIHGSGRSPGVGNSNPPRILVWASLVAQMVKNLPAMKETWVQSLGQEDPLEKGMDTPVFLPREFHGQRNLAGYSPWSHKQSDTTKRLNTHTTFQKLGTI